MEFRLRLYRTNRTSPRPKRDKRTGSGRYWTVDRVNGADSLEFGRLAVQTAGGGGVFCLERSHQTRRVQTVCCRLASVATWFSGQRPDASPPRCGDYRGPATVGPPPFVSVAAAEAVWRRLSS